MRFWSMQTLEAWEVAQKRGYLEGSSDHAMFPEQYLWMIEQMKKRLPNYEGEYPVWLWLEKPDMRSTSHFPGGTHCVRLTIELDEADVLVSDMHRWHLVLSNTFCSDSEKEDDDFNNGLIDITKEESWERIFDFSRDVDAEWTGDGEWKQGTTGRIYLEKVKKVEHFVARKQKEF